MYFLLWGFFFIFLVSIFFTKDFFHPSAFVSLLWFVVIFGYNFLAEKYEMKKIGIKVMMLFFLWSLGFSFSSLFASRKRFSLNSSFKKEPNYNLIRLLYPFVIISNILFLVLIFLLLGNGLSLTSLALIRRNFVDGIPPILKILYFINTLSVTYFFVCFYYEKTISKHKMFLLAFVLLILSVMKMTKTVFFMLFFAFIIILQKKNRLGVRKLFALGVIFAFFVIGLGVLRGDKGSVQDFTIMKYIVWYLCSSVAALNLVITRNIPLPNSVFGGHVFRAFYAGLGIVGLHFENTGFYGPWINVPFPTNVYTVVAPYYVDFGIIGVFVFAIIVGFFYGYIYSFVKRKIPYFTIYYSLLFYTLVMEFFSDYHFYIISVFVQYLIFVGIFYIDNKKISYIFKISK